MSIFDIFRKSQPSRRRHAAALAMPVEPKRSSLPKKGISSQPDDIYGWTLFDGVYALPFDIDVYTQLRKAEQENPDLAHTMKLWMAFANTGHHVEFAGQGSRIEQAQDVIHALAKRIYPGSAGADGLVNAYLRQLGLYGCISSENVLMPNLKGISYTALVSPAQVRIGPNATYWQRLRSGEKLQLNKTTYDYSAWCNVTDSPYALPPMIAALGMLDIQEDMLENIAHVMKKAGLLGMITAKIEQPMDRPGETDAEYDSRLSTIIGRVKDSLNTTFRNGILAHFDDVTIETKPTSASSTEAARLMQLMEEQVFTGAGLDPAMAGRSYSTTETYAGVVLRLLIQTAEAFRTIVKRRLEETYRLELALNGISNVVPKVQFEPIPTLKPLEEAQARQTKVATALLLIDAGIRTADEAAQELGYEKATGTPKETGGLFVRELKKKGKAQQSFDNDSLIQKFLESILSGYSNAADKVIARLLQILRSKSIDDFASAEEFADWTILEIRNAFAELELKPDEDSLKQLHTEAYSTAGLAALNEAGIKKLLATPDARTIAALLGGDNFFLSNFMYSQDYAGKARDMLKEKFIEEGKGLFGRLSQDIVDWFRNEMKDYLQETSDTAIRRIINTGVQRSRNWGIIDNLEKAGVTEVKVAGPDDDATCDICKALLQRTFRLVDVAISKEKEKSLLAAPVINRDDISAYFKQKRKAVAVVQNYEGDDEARLRSALRDGGALFPVHPECRHRLAMKR